MAPALQKSKVTIIQWFLSMTGKIFSALFFAFSLHLASISKLSLSIEANPMFKPDINDPKTVQNKAIPAQMRIF